MSQNPQRVTAALNTLAVQQNRGVGQILADVIRAQIQRYDFFELTLRHMDDDDLAAILEKVVRDKNAHHRRTG